MDLDPSTSNACSRFFSINEMLTLFLHHCPTRTLVTAQRVSKLWYQLINDSHSLQENLFMTPTTSNNNNNPIPPRLNPILEECFSPILFPATLDPSTTDPESQNPLFSSGWHEYASLSLLPWASQGPTCDAPIRKAYAYEWASWRTMYVSQPPIARLDWWHEWKMDFSDLDEDEREGFGHDVWGQRSQLQDQQQQQPKAFVTLGMLYDLVEARLWRGCEVAVVFFPLGMSVWSDPFAMLAEKVVDATAAAASVDGAGDGGGRVGGGKIAKNLPRVKIMSTQVWDHRPFGDEGFDPVTRTWRRGLASGRRSVLDDDCYRILREDCAADLKANSSMKRWSQSEGYWFAKIHADCSSRS